MQYKLLKNGKGYAASRKPQVVATTQTTDISFDNAPDVADAIFENLWTGDSCYRQIRNGFCTVPLRLLVGTDRVTVLDINGNTKRTWKCENLVVEQKEGVYVLYPENTDLEAKMLDLVNEIDELREKVAKVETTANRAAADIDELKNGYNIV